MLKSLTLSSILISESFLLLGGIFTFIRLLKKTHISDLINYFKRESDIDSSQKSIIYLLILLGIGLFILNLLQPISDYDSLAYHLPTMANWYQSGELIPNEQFKDQQIGYYPYNWELLCSLFLFPFREDFMVVFPNLILWFQFILSIFLISNKLGVPKNYSLFSAAIVSTLPIIISSINKIFTDLPLVFFFLAGLYFILCFKSSPSIHNFSLSLVSISMLSGIKSSGIGYGILLFIPFLFLIIRSIIELKKRKTIVFSFKKTIFSALGVIAIILPGIYWYIRNFLLLGNPMGMVELKLGDLLLFPGSLNVEQLRKTTLASIFNFSKAEDWRVLIGQIHIFLNFAFFIIFVLGILYIVSIFQKKKQINIKKYFFLISLLGITGYLYWITPYSADNGLYGGQITPFIGQGLRYGLPFIGILGIISSLGADRIKLSDRFALKIFLISYIICIIQIGKEIQSILPIYVLGAALIIWDSLFKKYSKKSAIHHFLSKFNLQKKVSIGILLIIILTIGFYYLRVIRDRNRISVNGNIVKYIDEKSNPKSTIGFFLSHRSYLLYGKKLNRKVKYIPINMKNKFHFFKYLKRNRIDMIAVGPLQQGWLGCQELKWINQNQKKFMKVFGRKPTGNVFLYKVKF